ncbi:MAG: nucleoside transporter C-terminal domain-containing protein [Bacteroidia bacterium]|nr:nucleoside transporter C-terminal domain-containing protein [Bacteroidia bacterium]
MKKFLVLLTALCIGTVVFAQQPSTDATLVKDTLVTMADSVAATANVQETAAAVVDMTPAENPYKAILLERTFSFSFSSFLRGLVGMLVILLIAWIFSVDRKRINWGTVLKALALQLLIAISVLAFPAVQKGFELFGQGFVAVLDWTKAGSNFLFGSFMDVSKFGFVFVFQILPTIIFFSALTSLLFYLGVLQKIVWAMGWALTKLMKLSGAESLSCAGNIFLGQTEAPLTVKEYIPRMTRSELMLVMTSGMATMAGGVLAAYIGMLGAGDKVLEVEFAKHLLSASVMAAPGAIAISKILKPQTEEIDNSVEISKDKIGKNILDSITNGSTEGLKLAANIAAMLLVFYALIAGVNCILSVISFPAVDRLIESLSGGRYTDLSLEVILAVVFSPVIWLTGVPSEDIGLVGRLLGEKLILTEFVGYQSLADMIRTGAFASTKSVILATYILCGFANFASVGIQIGGIGGMAPNKRHILSEYGFRSLLGATLVALLSAAMVGMFLV